MAGNKTGGLKAAKKNLERDPDFYKKIGAKGGRNGHTGGFASDHERARLAGAKGGKRSKRTPAQRDEHGRAIKKDGTPYSRKKRAKKPVVKRDEYIYLASEPEPRKSFLSRLFKRGK